MKRFPLLLALGLALSSPALAQQGPPRRAYANPSAAIAADIAFSRLARTKGRWTAFRETAAPDAIMFVPQMVVAQSWLKKRPDPAAPLAWQPHGAWSSCDGSLILTSGAAQLDGKPGWYTTIWQRQADGAYKWVFDHGGPLETALAAPDMLEARVAECPPRRPEPAGAAPPAGKPGGKPGKPAKAPPLVLDPAGHGGSARDGSLTWDVRTTPGGGHRLTVQMRKDGAMQQLRDEAVPGTEAISAPGAGKGGGS